MPDAQLKQATLRDVADLAGVSYQTVWRVVKEHPHVAEETRRRVQAAVRELDYRPHRAAQMLTTGRSYILQLIIFEGGYGNPLPAMLHWIQEYGYTVVVTEIRDATSRESVRAALRETAHMVDGLLMVMPYAHLGYEELNELCQGRPFVMACTKLGSRMPSVVFDQWNGARQVVEYLIGLGHRRIAEISGPLDNYDAGVRHSSVQRCLELNGLEVGPKLAGDFEVCSGYGGVRELLSSGWDFSALVMGNDHMALGALRALREAGLRVPEDVSVVGFDDIPEAAYFDPPLTTVRQDFDVLARESVEYLVSLIEASRASGSWRGSVQQRVFYPELMIRQSTRPVCA